ncbi:4'-phosphopantetheinyl transferase family protein [Microlunatus flavus]|uniref:4'-phosphopantetheinyl transferase family protein n=1 Tax=Microlunatus flavus TaxID=1036181 RepID=UPI000B81AA32|nr:4'-phosphopantetheinyl transferase superfamily protein [Microlunatus flavus]
MARLGAANELAVAVAEVELDRTCPRCGGAHGKPVLTTRRAHLSIAHSAGTVAVAVCRPVPVGLDVEARTAADPALAALVRPERPPTDPQHALQLWCRMESAVKATGDGLLVPIQQVRVSEADQPPRLLGYPGRRLEVSMHDLTLRPGYAAALSVLTAEPVTVLTRDATALLGL